MKKFLFTFSAIIIAVQSQAQSFEVGLNGSINNTWLLNKNVSDQNDELNPSFTIAGAAGITATYYFNEKVGLGIEANSAAYNQKYSGDDNAAVLFRTGTTGTFDAKTKLRYTEIPLLLKLKSEGGFYFEVGPMFSFLGKATETASTTPGHNSNYTDTRVKTGFNSSLLSGVFGFGGRFDASDNIVITAGLRFSASFNDATKKFTEAEIVANLLNPNAASYFGSSGITNVYAHTKQTGDYKYEKTTAVRGGIQISVIYKIPTGGSSTPKHQ